MSELDRVLALERAAMRAEARVERRKGILGAAYWAALNDRERVREALRANTGVWWPELAPLAAEERTALLVQLRHVFGLRPDPRLKPAEGVPRRDQPDMRDGP